MDNTITIKETITIAAPQEVVWDYSQNFDTRCEWDKSIKACEVLAKRPYKLIALKLSGGVLTKLKYKLCRKPHKTSLQMIDTQSFFIKGGGGSWTYATRQNKTEWTQQNTLILKHRLLFILFGQLLKQQLSWSTRLAMKRAKKIIEKKVH